MIIFNSIKRCVSFLLIINNDNVIVGVIIFLLPLSFSLQANVDWTFKGIFTFIGIARKFRQNFYSMMYLNCLQTQYIMSADFYIAVTIALFTTQISIARAHQLTNSTGTFE